MRRSLRAVAMAACLFPAARPVSADPTDGGVTIPAPSEASAGYAPDPPPMVTRHQWVLDFAYHAGAVSIAGARRVELPQPTATARLMGRFAVELYIGKELLERVRFDFPLLGADESGGRPPRWDGPPSFERQLSSRTAVMVPHSERATRARLVDRATGRTWALLWPPVPSPDGGPPLLNATSSAARSQAPLPGR